ncbi:uncharacterized protein [Elaeis guineensis]|uniref:uncharacterized protein n=1 Tax=Elaeis guineensis var. tenera TaxID=51953 RepID=UPI003C6D5DD6
MAVMRLKKGTKVEILSKCGSWRPAEIISGNGHTYSVKYDSHQRAMATVTERVPRKVIRPLPPSVDCMMYWSPGDIVEALENHSWKLVQVLSAAAGDCYFVKILGSSKHIIAHKSEIRVRQAWKDNHWVIIQEDAARFQDGIRSVEEEEVNSPVSQPSQEVKNHQVIRQVPHKDHSGFEKGQRKRQRICSSPVKLLTHGSLNHTELNDAQSVSSSVGSCSPCAGPYRPYCNPIACPTQDMDSLLNNADAYRHAIRKSYSAKKDEQKGKFHPLELHAYRLTSMMNTWKQSRALTWKQEAHLTNLRLRLHISNDEHQSELKRLASTQSDRERVMPKLL